MHTKAPTTITTAIADFCREISPKGDLSFVAVRPAVGAKPNQCFFNVEDQAKRSNGKMVCGWTIWEWPDIYIEAEFHSVLQMPSGELVDVTPKVDGESRILFVTDHRVKFYVANPKWRDNIRKPLVDDKRVEKFLLACSAYQRFEIRHSSASGKNRVVNIPPHLIDRFKELDQARALAGRAFKEFLDG